MTFTERSHLNRLIEWRSDAAVPLDPERLHRRWMSPLLPTRRFGPDAWVAFQTANEPNNLNLGGFRSWVLFDAHALRLIAYLESPMAETFGAVQPFPKPTLDLDEALIADLGTAGIEFFAVSEPSESARSVRDAIRSLEDDYYKALAIAAPDFLAWIGA